MEIRRKWIFRDPEAREFRVLHDCRFAWPAGSGTLTVHARQASIGFFPRDCKTLEELMDDMGEIETYAPFAKPPVKGVLKRAGRKGILPDKRTMVEGAKP